MVPDTWPTVVAPLPRVEVVSCGRVHLSRLVSSGASRALRPRRLSRLSPYIRLPIASDACATRLRSPWCSITTVSPSRSSRALLRSTLRWTGGICGSSPTSVIFTCSAVLRRSASASADPCVVPSGLRAGSPSRPQSQKRAMSSRLRVSRSGPIVAIHHQCAQPAAACESAVHLIVRASAPLIESVAVQRRTG